MTTIAYDGRFIAADGMQQREGIIIERRAVKLMLGELGVYAMTGHCGWFPAWVGWAEDGSRPEAVPPAQTSTESLLIRVKWAYDPATGSDHAAIPAEMASTNLPYWANEAAPSAWGSGREHAVTAMDLGQNAMVAVHMASLRDTSTGGRIMFVDTWAPQTERRLQEWDGELSPQIRERVAACLGSQCDDPGERLIAGAKARDLNDAMMTQVLREALSPEWVRITKPQAPHREEGTGRNVWLTPECTGRLVLGTGCGGCLRCNREWHVLVRGPHETVDATTVRVHRGEVAAQTTAAPLASAAPQTAKQVLEEWVGKWNDAQRAGDTRAVAKLNTELMSITIPAGIELALDPPMGASGHWRRRLVDAATKAS